MLKNCKDGFFHMESFKSEIFLGWKIQGFFRILIIEKEKFIFWEFPICWNITGIEFLPIETIWNYWLIFELFHLGPNSPALNGQIDYQISNKKTFCSNLCVLKLHRVSLNLNKKMTYLMENLVLKCFILNSSRWIYSIWIVPYWKVKHWIVPGEIIQFELFHIEKLNIELFQVELFNLNCSILKS